MPLVQHRTENIVGGTIRVTWSQLANGDFGTTVHAPDHGVKDVQVTGTFGAAGNCRIEGTLDNATYAALNDAQGNVLDIAAAKIERVQETTAGVRPSITNGDVTTALNIIMILKPTEVFS